MHLLAAPYMGQPLCIKCHAILTYIRTRRHTQACEACVFLRPCFIGSLTPPHPLTGFGLVSVTKPDVFRWHKFQELLFQDRSRPPFLWREWDSRLSSNGLSWRCYSRRHSASLNCDYNGIIAYRHHQIAVRGLDARFRQSGCRSVGLANEAS